MDFDYVTSSVDGPVQTFAANMDSDTIVSNSFLPRVARFVRVSPQESQGANAMRWEVYGCEALTCQPIQIENGFVNSSDVMVGTQVRVECESGFVLHNASISVASLDVECGIYGEWSTNLTLVSCDEGTFHTLQCNLKHSLPLALQ